MPFVRISLKGSRSVKERQSIGDCVHRAMVNVPPLQGGMLLFAYQGLKPLAESYYPFGISPTRFPTDACEHFKHAN